MSKTKIIVTDLEVTAQKDWALRPFEEYSKEIEAEILSVGEKLVWYENQEKKAREAYDINKELRTKKTVAAITRNLQLLLNMFEIIKRLEIQKSVIAAEHFKAEKEAAFWKEQCINTVKDEEALNQNLSNGTTDNLTFYDH